MKSDNKKEYFDAKLFAISYGMEQLVEIIDDLKNEKISYIDINSLMELYNVRNVILDKKYNEYYPELNEYIDISEKIDRIINDYFKGLSYEIMCTNLKDCVLTYKIEYIELLLQRELYKKVDVNKYIEFTNFLSCYPNVYLKNKKFVEYFRDEIKKQLFTNNIYAEIYIEQWYCEKENKESIYLPQLTHLEIEEILKRYINDKNVRLNYLDKIINTKEFKRYETIRYQASQKREKLVEELFKNQQGLLLSVEVHSGPNEKNSTKYIDGKTIICYNTNELKDNLDYPSILNNFIYLFEYVNYFTMICNLVSKNSYAGTLEKFFRGSGKDEYKINDMFTHLDMVSYVQLTFYIDFLSQNNINIEEIIKWFFTKYLLEEFDITGFEISIAKEHASYFEKCKDLVTIFDEIKRQYCIWVENGHIDRKLVEFSTMPIDFKNIPSITKQHYFYNLSGDINKEISMLFSDQSMLGYIERFKDKYNTLFLLLLHEDITIDDFYPYQTEQIHWLINRSVLQYDGKYIRLNYTKFLYLKLLYDDEVINITKVNKETLLEIFKSENYEIKNTLLSKSEAAYFDYYLNDKYINGKEIRNKYSHGTASKDEKICKQDYYIIIRLLIILMIKINDDLCTYFDNNESNKEISEDV